MLFRSVACRGILGVSENQQKVVAGANRADVAAAGGIAVAVHHCRRTIYLHFVLKDRQNIGILLIEDI